MPGQDGTGPAGYRPGRGLGPCGQGGSFRRGQGRGYGSRAMPDYQDRPEAGDSMPRAGVGRGQGGLGRGPCAYVLEKSMRKGEPKELSAEDQKKILEARLDQLEQEMKGIEERLKNL